MLSELAGVFLSLAACIAAAEPASYRAGARELAEEMERQHGFDRQEVANLLAEARYRQEIIDAIRRPWEAKPWHQYRAIFLTDARSSGGVRFWRENRHWLERADATYGVPPEIITAIIGVETNYGGNLGRHRAIDALSTLGFSYPERADFFRKELASFLLLTREESVSATGATGSYAGALGLPQFIPSSYRAYAVDFDGDGRRDLWASPADAIGSVASYFKGHGWRAGEPVAVPARLAAPLPEGLRVADGKPAKPEVALGELAAQGVQANEVLDASTLASLIRLEAPEEEYWLGLENFYVITRYNHSNLYAMAVYQLSLAIKSLFEAEGGQTAAAD